MDDLSLTALAATAAVVGLVHTLTGPDHYLPFVAMARVGRWSLRKTVAVTLACGAGHVISSVALGAAGIAAGAAAGRLTWLEGIRGEAAGWLLMGFGLAYLVWGIRRAIRHRRHTHWHTHADGTVHSHGHVHENEHSHVHTDEGRTGSMTPWILFTIFVLGPCEPLIPLLMYPAAKVSLMGIVLVTVIFGLSTLATMTAVVAAGCLGLSQVGFRRAERYGHAVAGAAIAACGAAMKAGL